MKRMILRTLCLAAILCLLTPYALATGALPYDCYNYDYWNNILYTPAPYVPDGNISGVSLIWQGESLGAFRSPQDLCVSPDGALYIADTGNNRIVVLSEDMKTVLQVIDGFEADGKQETFNAPYGVAVSENRQLYIADSQNRRIVVLELDGTFVKYVQNPQSEVLDEKFVFTPLKVSVDYADRVYCVAQNMFQGIMVFSSEGEFTGFFGTISVKISLWERFWRKIATKEERSKQQLFIPTEFTGIDVDEEGFVYASNKDTDGIQAVRRLNPRGEDVIRKGPKENVGGDLVFNSIGIYSGPSQIVDVVYRDHGIYSLLDAKRGRIFTYDHEGNLLYIFGGIGTQEGTFRMPAAIEQLGDRLLVLDSLQATVNIFAVTEYGALINKAVGLRFNGDESQAIPLWQEVLKLDENNELANSGIGKAYLSAGDNENALLYLRRGMNRAYYSVAFKRWRNEALRDNISWFLTGVVVLVVLLVIWHRFIKPKRVARRVKGGKTA
ncbi:MAG: gluconolactonase [Clostridia bacterium]|nr:gluconolactonase [Clostridia bacterium]MBR5382914.1 gluconolactonase [Clostridia bacterium]